jgi:hypothetical protein
MFTYSPVSEGQGYGLDKYRAKDTGKEEGQERVSTHEFIYVHSLFPFCISVNLSLIAVIAWYQPSLNTYSSS